jgi:DNA processing protein
MHPKPSTEEGIRALLALSMRYPHPSTLIRWLKAWGNPVRALEVVERSEGRSGRVAARVPAGDVDRAMDLMRERGIRLVSLEEPDYPAALRFLPVPPPVLFVRGDVGLLRRVSVAIVGTRRATGYGRDVARWLGSSLGREGLVVVSGMARGVDTEAHIGCLEAGGRTVAVVGTGLDAPYPRENARLMERIGGEGCLVSEFPPMTAPLPRNFPRRNRIISGLSAGVVVVEAPVRSGALITAGFALEQGKAVLAVPGPIWTEQSRGPLALLRDGAAPVLEIRDVTDAVGWRGPSAGADRVASAPPADDSVPGSDLEGGLDYTFRHVDEIAARCGVAPAELLGRLLVLELSGAVEQRPGKYFRLRRR